MAGCCSVLGAFLFEYDTLRMVLIRSRKEGLMNRAVQLFILAYVIRWVFVWEKGYQEVDSVVSSVTTKAKGVTVTNTSQLGFRIWDVADYVIPAQEESSLFIMTNIIVTMNQTQGFCPEIRPVCVSHTLSCWLYRHPQQWYERVATGRCVPYNGTLKTCEVAAWCPVEDDSNVPRPAFLKAAENFTLLVKNNIWYPKFNFTMRNILPNITTTYLKSCIYNAATDPFCPIFRLGKIVENAGHSFQDMAVEGGIMGIQIKWDCNLDRAASFCLPRYSFRRLDTRDLDHNVSPGYNFRAFHFLLLVGLLWLFWSQLQDESEPLTMPACCDDMFLYETNKVIQIQNTSYGTIKWFFHMIVFSYVSFALLCDKRYQRKEPLTSSVHTKVKGIAEVREEILKNGEEVHRVFDTADYTFPVQGNSFFVMTNFLKTKGQVQGLCPEHPTRRTLCSSDRGCKKGWLDPQSKGIQTGKCIPYKPQPPKKTCEVSAWCPTEATEEPPQPALLNSAENFTVLIKNNIDFPGHNYTTRNILPDLNITCTYHKTQNPQCPIFRLGDIFQETGYNFSEVAIKGGIMGIEINWDCNLDSWFHHCRPKYSFRRLDDKTTNESLYPGYNFRYAKYYKENNVEKRTLMKVFGVRFDILVFGSGGKFDIIALIVYIGSTLSYFGLATVFIDFLINTYSNTSCQSYVYPYCKCCECCAVNEYYYKKKCESIVEPKSTLKYVSFVDESHIRMVEEQLLGRSLQNVKGKEIPRPLMDFTDLSRLPLSLQDAPPIPGQPEEIQLLSEEATPRSSSSPSWCQCGNCLPSQLPRSHQCLEELCCRKKPGACITTSEPFKKLILSRRALQFLLLYQEPLLKLDADATNNQLRHCAYRCYATWRFGSKDLADFAILPSCCRWRIRKEFPKSEGQYSGFKSPY